jgi:hypothetical protein
MIKMRALSYLLGTRAIDTAMSSEPSRGPSEPPFLPIASTPDQAAAWRRWAAEGRASADHGEPISSRPLAVPRAARRIAQAGNL